MNHSQSLQVSYEQAFRENQELKAQLEALTKESRRVLVSTNVWQQEFHSQEILSIIAMYQATKTLLTKKEGALDVAMRFIKSVEDGSDFEIGLMAGEALEKIEQLLINKR